MLLAAAVLSSCEHKEIFADKPEKQIINIHFNWDNILFDEPIPATMKLYFYNDKTGEVKDFALSTSRNDQFIELTSGVYDLICYNSMANGVVSSNTTSLNDHVISLKDNTKESPVMYGHNYFVKITNADDDSSNSSIQTITIAPQRMHRMYMINVSGIDMVKDAVSWSGTLTGLASTINALDLMCAESSSEARITAPLFPSTMLNACSNKIRTFGRLNTSTSQEVLNKLIVTATKSDKTQAHFLFNVTYQVLSAPGMHNAVIDVDLKDATPLKPGDPDYPASL